MKGLTLTGEIAPPVPSQETFIRTLLNIWSMEEAAPSLKEAMNFTQARLSELNIDDGVANLMRLRGQTLSDQLLTAPIHVHDALRAFAPADLSESEKRNLLRGLALACLAYALIREPLRHPDLLSPLSHQQLELTRMILGQEKTVNGTWGEIIVARLTLDMACPAHSSRAIPGATQRYTPASTIRLLDILIPRLRKLSVIQQDRLWISLQNLSDEHTRWTLSAHLSAAMERALVPANLSPKPHQWSASHYTKAEKEAHPLLRETKPVKLPDFSSITLMAAPAKLTHSEYRRLEKLLEVTLSILNSSWPGEEPDSPKAREAWFYRARARLGQKHPGQQVLQGLARALSILAPDESEPVHMTALLHACDAGARAAMADSNVLRLAPDLFISPLKAPQRRTMLARRTREGRLSVLDAGLSVARMAFDQNINTSSERQWAALLASQCAQHRVNAWETPMRSLSNQERAQIGQHPPSVTPQFIVFAGQRHSSATISCELIGYLSRYSREARAAEPQENP